VVHILAETSRHAGQADILREQLDGAVGTGPQSPALPDHDAAYWKNHCAKIEQAAGRLSNNGRGVTKAWWMSSRISQRMRRRRNQCGNANAPAATGRCTPRPEPCSVPRRAMTGLISSLRTWSR
jgi:Protein of unknown function (DUF664)